MSKNTLPHIPALLSGRECPKGFKIAVSTLENFCRVDLFVALPKKYVLNLFDVKK
jgi:hypothetical protein